MKRILIAYCFFWIAVFSIDYVCPVCKHVIRIDKDGKVFEIWNGHTNLINTNTVKIAFVGANEIEGRSKMIVYHIGCNTNKTVLKAVYISATNFKATNISKTKTEAIK